MQSRLRVTIVAVVCATALCSCDLLAGLFPPDTSFTFRPEQLLPVDADLHFLADKVYTYTSWGSFSDTELSGKVVYTYAADGTYESLSSMYEPPGQDLNENGAAGEGYFLFWGERGTYTYDPAQLLLTVAYTSMYYTVYSTWDEALSEYVDHWVDTPVWQDYLAAEHSNQFFIDRDFGQVYVASGGEADTWVATSGTTYSGGYAYDYTTTMVVSSSGITYSYVGRDTEPGGSPVVTYESEWVMDVQQTFPEGVAFEEGETVQFFGFCSVGRYRYWDYGLDAMGDWQDSWQLNEITSYEFTHMGGFIVSSYDLGNFARGLAARGPARRAR